MIASTRCVSSARRGRRRGARSRRRSPGRRQPPDRLAVAEDGRGRPPDARHARAGAAPSTTPRRRTPARPAPAAPVPVPARRVQRRLRVEPVVHGRRDQLDVALRLHVPAHHAERPDRLAAAGQEARDDRVERALARRHLVRVALARVNPAPRFCRPKPYPARRRTSRSPCSWTGSGSPSCRRRRPRRGRRCRRAPGRRRPACGRRLADQRPARRHVRHATAVPPPGTGTHVRVRHIRVRVGEASFIASICRCTRSPRAPRRGRRRPGWPAPAARRCPDRSAESPTPRGRGSRR